MTDHDGHPDPDEALVAELQAFFTRVDPVPPVVTEAARAALGWRRLDADLAELLSDSLLEDESLALTRGVQAGVRSVSFSAGEVTIDLEVHADGETRVLMGQLSPPRAARIAVQRPGSGGPASDPETFAAAESDELGRFRAQVPGGGMIRLVVAGVTDAIQSSWITV